MDFTVPQFIEKDPKIVGPFTFKQFISVGGAGAICIVLYFTVPIPVFLIAAIFLVGGGLAMAFLKVEKTPLPELIKNSLTFIGKPKIYLWQKKSVVMQKDKKMKIDSKEVLDKAPIQKRDTTLKKYKSPKKIDIKLEKESRLRNLINRLDIK